MGLPTPDQEKTFFVIVPKVTSWRREASPIAAKDYREPSTGFWKRPRKITERIAVAIEKPHGAIDHTGQVKPLTQVDTDEEVVFELIHGRTHFRQRM